MKRTLLEGVTRGIPGGDAVKIVPTAALKKRAVRALLRDLDAMGVTPELAAKVVKMVMKALEHTLDDSDILPSDKTAAALVAHRVALATVVAILQAPSGPTDD